MLQPFSEDHNINPKKSALKISKYYMNKMPFLICFLSYCYCSCCFTNMHFLFLLNYKIGFALGLCSTICLDLEGGGSGPRVVRTD